VGRYCGVGVLTGTQLDRLLTEPDTTAETTARVRRRIMTRLSGLGLVRMLDRRIGGARAGSAGHVYTLTSAGHTFLALHRGQPAPGRIRRSLTPSALFLNHALAVSEIYVQLTEASSTGRFRVAHFRAPAWWPLGDSLYLRPDAYLVLDTGRYSDCWWLEIDRATEPLPRVRDKYRDYLDHAVGGGTGPDGALPRVLLTTPTPKRCAAIFQLISDLHCRLTTPSDGPVQCLRTRRRSRAPYHRPTRPMRQRHICPRASRPPAPPHPSSPFSVHNAAHPSELGRSYALLRRTDPRGWTCATHVSHPSLGPDSPGLGVVVRAHDTPGQRTGTGAPLLSCWARGGRSFVHITLPLPLNGGASWLPGPSAEFAVTTGRLPRANVAGRLGVSCGSRQVVS
jgi:hypothetical protein